MKTLMIIAWLTGVGADAGSTAYALHRGGRELVLSQSTVVDTTIIAGEGVVGTWGLLRLYKTHPRLAVTVGVAAGIGRSLIAAHNIRVVAAGDGLIRLSQGAQ